MSARLGSAVAPSVYTLPLPSTPRHATESTSVFSRKTLTITKNGLGQNDGNHQQPHAPLSARPPSGEAGGYKRSVGLLQTLDINKLGTGGSQSARGPPKVGPILPSAPIPKMPTVPESVRLQRPGTGSFNGTNSGLVCRSNFSVKEAPKEVVKPTHEDSSADSQYTSGTHTKLPPDGSMGKMVPAKALELYESRLSKYEKREILDYDEIFYVGLEANKIQAPVAEGANFGYDDDKGDYVVVNGDHIAYRYEVMGGLGKGSFGQVLQVKDHKKGSVAALKLIRNKKRFHQQAMIEIKILDHLRCRDPEERSCTVRMLNYFKFRSHTVITFDMHSINLYELTKLNGYQPFAPALIKRFTAQLLVSLAFMWQEQIVHCDIKPENVLLRYENKTSLKLIDFGSSCFENERIYTYIQSRFYRAPEIILGIQYGRKIDMWSLGCVICEMQMGFPIFPGESEAEQIQCIMEVMGIPPSRIVEKAPRRNEFFEANGTPKIVPNTRNKVRKPGTKDLAKVLRSEDEGFVDFVKQFLQWDPTERVTPQEAMHHPWITECFRHVDQKPTAPSEPAPAKEQGRRTSVGMNGKSKQLPAIEKKNL